MRYVKIAGGLIATACAFGIGATSALAAAPEFEAKPNEVTKVETFKAVKGLGLKQSFSFPIRYLSIAPGSEEFKETFKVTCEKTKETGSTTGLPSANLTVQVGFKACFTGKEKEKGNGAHFVPIGPGIDAEFEYHAAVPVGVSAAAGTIDIKHAIEIKLASTKCLLTIPAQTLGDTSKAQRAQFNTDQVAETGSKAIEKVFPEGFQDRLDIENTVSVLNFAEPKEEPEDVGLAFEVAPIRENHGLCAGIPETVEEKVVVNKKTHEEAIVTRDPRESELGTYSGKLELELPKGQLKVS